MTENDFLNEVYTYIGDTYNLFENYQKSVWNIFTVFNNLCRKNKIVYYMGFGSLIGIVRDKGPIPWDYDVDTIVRVNDKDKLLRILKESLPESYYYTYTDCIRDYPTTCLRICKKGFPFTAIHLDVYFMIGLPDDNPQKLVNKIDYYHKLRNIKYGNKWFPDESDSHNSSLINFARKLRNDLISSRRIENFEKKVLVKYPLENSTYCSIVGDPYLKVYNTKDFEATIDVEVNNVKIAIPSGYDHFLTEIYGDYHKYLPISNRFSEFYHMTEIVKKRNNLMNSKYSNVFQFCK